MDATRGEDVVRLPPFYFGQTQDRGNGKNLCRSHPQLAPSLVPHRRRFQARKPISDSNGKFLLFAPRKSGAAQLFHIREIDTKTRCLLSVPAISCDLNLPKAATGQSRQTPRTHRSRISGGRSDESFSRKFLHTMGGCSRIPADIGACRLQPGPEPSRREIQG
jgi:hypothetical protein